jgi:hypothetical protein
MPRVYIFTEWWYGRPPPIHTRDDSATIVEWLSDNSFSLLSPVGICWNLLA